MVIGKKLTGTGWNKGPCEIIIGKSGLVGDWWGKLGVTVDLKAVKEVALIHTTFGTSLKLYTSADGKTWKEIMKIAPTT